MFDELPAEILITIFGFLSHSDRKDARLTCKHFYRTSLAYSLIRNESIQIDPRMLKPEGKIITTALINTDRLLYHVSVSNINNYDYFWIFNKFGNTLETVILKKCTADYSLFSYIVSKLKAIETLHVINCDNLLIEGKIFLPAAIEQNPFLKNLKALEISDTMYLTDKALSRFLIIFPNINHLSLENTTINCHQGVYHFNYNNNSNILESPSSNVLTINYVSALINSKRKNIQSLNFANTIINNIALSQILRTEDLKLNRLNISFCRELRQNDDMTIGFWQLALSELQISSCDLVTNDFLKHICTSMSNLTILNISHNDNINDLGFRYVEYLEQLTELDISNCSNISTTIMRYVICSKNLKTSIRKLKLSNTNISDDDLMYMTQMLSLSELEVSCCNRLSNQWLSTLFEKQKILKRLEMSGVDISDTGITGLSESSLCEPSDSIKQFEYRSISHPFLQADILKDSECYYSMVESFHIKSPPYSIQDLQNLVTLNLSRCKKITDLIFAASLRLKNLRELNLFGLPGVTTRSLFSLVYNCPAIEILDLSGTSVDDVGICVLVQKLTRLKHLFLKDCLKISNETLIFIIQHCKVLQKLNIQGCCNLDEDLINKIKNMPNMLEVIGTPNETFEMDGRVPIAPPPPLFIQL